VDRTNDPYGRFGARAPAMPPPPWSQLCRFVHVWGYGPRRILWVAIPSRLPSKSALPSGRHNTANPMAGQPLQSCKNY